MERRAVDALIISLAQSAGGVVTVVRLADAGVPRHAVRARIGGLLTPVTKGVYVVGALTPSTRLRAALAAMPQAAGSHRTAAGLHGLPLPPGRQVDVVAPGESRRTIDGVRIRMTRWLPGDDVVVTDGVRVTSVARTLCDLSGEVGRSRLRHLVEEAVVSEATTVDGLQACATDWCRRGRRGSRLLQALDHELFDIDPIPGSELERRAIGLFHRSGICGWVREYRPPWYDGVRGVVDLAWPDRQLLVELDGRRWHTVTQARDDDHRRDRLAITHGWAPVRFGWQEVVRRPATVVAQLNEIMATLAARARPV